MVRAGCQSRSSTPLEQRTRIVDVHIASDITSQGKLNLQSAKDDDTEVSSRNSHMPF
jgi:hypothetical protein